MNLPLAAYLDLASHILPVGAGAVQARKLTNEPLLMFAFVILGMGVEFATFILAELRIHNLWLLNLYVLAEYFILAFLFAGWQKHELVGRLLKYSTILYALVWVLAKLSVESFGGFGAYTRGISGLVFVAACIGSLTDLVGREMAIHKVFRFWVTIGVLAYFTGNTLLFGLGEMIPTLAFKDAVAIWTIHWYISVLVNGCYTIGFLCLRWA